MTDFQVGDRVIVEGVVMETLEPGEVMLSLPQGGTTLQVWAEDLTLEPIRYDTRDGAVIAAERWDGMRPEQAGRYVVCALVPDNSAGLRDTIRRAAATLDGLDPELRKTMAQRTRMRGDS